MFRTSGTWFSQEKFIFMPHIFFLNSTSTGLKIRVAGHLIKSSMKKKKRQKKYLVGSLVELQEISCKRSRSRYTDDSGTSWRAYGYILRKGRRPYVVRDKNRREHRAMSFFSDNLQSLIKKLREWLAVRWMKESQTFSPRIHERLNESALALTYPQLPACTVTTYVYIQRERNRNQRERVSFEVDFYKLSKGTHLCFPFRSGKSNWSCESSEISSTEFYRLHLLNVFPIRFDICNGTRVEI